MAEYLNDPRLEQQVEDDGVMLVHEAEITVVQMGWEPIVKVWRLALGNRSLTVGVDCRKIGVPVGQIQVEEHEEHFDDDFLEQMLDGLAYLKWYGTRVSSAFAASALTIERAARLLSMHRYMTPVCH